MPVLQDDDLDYKSSNPLIDREEFNSLSSQKPELEENLYGDEGDKDENDDEQQEVDELENLFKAPSFGEEDLDKVRKQKEANDNDADEEDSLYNPDAKGIRAKYRNSKSRLGKLRAKISEKTKRFRKLALISGAAGVVIFGIIMYLVMQLGANKLIQITESVTAWNSARSARAFRLGTKQMLEESVALNSDNQSYIAKLKTTFGESKAGKMIERYNNLFKPEKVFKNLKADIKPVYFQKKFQGLEIGRAFISYEDPGLKNKFFHPIKTRAERIRFAGELNGVIEERLSGSSSFVRNSVYKKIMSKYGLKYNFLYKRKAAFKSASQQASERIVLQETVNNTFDDDAICTIHKTLCSSAQKADDALKEVVDEAVDDVNAGGAADVEDKALSAAAKEVLGAQAENNILKYVGKASLVYSVMVPICIIYAGSMENSADAIDRNETSLTKLAVQHKVMAHEAKAGVLPTEAVMGVNATLGDYTDSVVYSRDSGNEIDSSKEISSIFQPESSNVGTYGPSQALFGDNAVAKVLDEMANDACPVITDPLAGYAIVGLELILQGILAASSGGTSGGATQVGKEAVDQSVQSALKRITGAVLIPTTRAIVKEQGYRAASRFVLRSANRFVLKTGLYVAGVSQLTIMTRSFVMKQSAAQHSGIMSDAGKINQIDMGVNLMERNINRDMLYGAPMTTSDVVASNKSDSEYIASTNSRRGFVDRYLSTTNPFSVVSKFGNSLSGSLGIDSKSLFRFSNFMRTSMRNLGNTFSGRVFADGSTLYGAGPYNIVQWGWSDRELRFLDNDTTGIYGTVYNKLTVTENPKFKEVKNKYQKCFTESVGKLLAEGKIDREESGRVIEDTGDIDDCSPRNLGPSNPQYGDLVFRWRLMNFRDAMQNHFYQAQELTDEEVVL